MHLFPYYFTEIKTWSFTGVSGEVVSLSLAVSLPIVINVSVCYEVCGIYFPGQQWNCSIVMFSQN